MTERNLPVLLCATLGCAILLLVFVAAACVPAAQPTPQVPAVPAVQPTPQAPTQQGSPTLGLARPPDHIVIVIEENKGYDDIIGSPNAPYLNGLAERGASLGSFYAFHHPSQPNYFEFFAGTNTITYTVNGGTQRERVLDDNCVQHLATSQPSLGGLLGKEFLGYAEGWDPNIPTATPPPSSTPPPPPIPCTIEAAYFARKHDPWMMFSDSIAASRPLGEFAKIASKNEFDQLPKVSIVIPNLIDDMHSSPGGSAEGTDIPLLVQNGDAWLKAQMDGYVEWAVTHNSLLIVTWDENSLGKEEGHDDGTGFKWPLNHIPTILVGQMVKPGSRSNVVYNHYDLLRTIEDMYKPGSYLGGSANAKDILDIWQ